MKKKTLISLLVIVGIIISIIIYSAASEEEKAVVLTTRAEKGDFEIIVNVTGELKAERSMEIMAPSGLRSRFLRFGTVKILDMVPEGTVVDSGDWVATLDRTEADNTLKDLMDRVEETKSEYIKAKLDTTIQLRQLRDELINLRFNVEEMKIALEQSKYEPPATIRQAQINLDKAERALEQASNNYHLKAQQAKADMTEVTIDLAQEERRVEEMEEVMDEFDIHAPAPGMVIYKQYRRGSKRTIGSEIHPWDLAVATLPDLSTLVSRTFVNEIDISKILEGQEVRIGVDAFPEKKYTGIVTDVANIGEQLNNSDAKVFEVLVRMNERDTILRPAMTTSNQIITNVYRDVVYIPLEAIHNNDSLTFVYTTKNDKQVVVLGESNENAIIAEQGLEPGEEIYLSIPENPENFRIKGEELYQVIKNRKEEEERRRKQEQARIEQSVQGRDQMRNGTVRAPKRNN